MSNASALNVDLVNRPQGTECARTISTTWFSLVVMLLLGAAVRVGLWSWFANLPIEIDDEQAYNTLAKNLVEHGEFAFNPGTLTSLRPPLYPALVAGIYSLFGLENYQAVRLIQALLSLINVLVLYGLAVEVISRRAALWAAGLFCFYPTLVGFDNLLLTETLFTLLLCSFCYFMALAFRRQRMGFLVAAGLLMGLAALTRSVLVMFPPVLAIFLFATWRGTWRRKGLAVLTVLAPFAATLAPWTIRNTFVQETFVPVDTMGGRNFLMGNYAHTPLYRSWDAIAFEDERAWYHAIYSKYPFADRSTQGKLDKLAFNEGVGFVREHPWLTLKRDIIKFFDFWGLERELVAGAAHKYFGQLPGVALIVLAIVICGSFAASLFLGVFGLFLTRFADLRVQAFLFVVVAFICGLHTVVFAHSRYHLPVMPIVFIFAASAITTRPEFWRQWRSVKYWLAAGVCGFITFGWVWGFAAGDFEKVRALFQLTA